MSFKPDIRSLGGQKTINNMLESHYTALVNVKSTFSSRVPPKPHVAAA